MTSADPSGPEPSGPIVVDARGRRCPLPVIDLARAARAAPDGALIEVLADDPAAASDIPAWCRMRGHDYLGSSSVNSSPTDEGGPQRAAAHRIRLR